MTDANRYDAVVIGGGLGGLTAGARLAKEGRRVLLVEQHSVPGGYATTFRRKHFTMEVALHEIDGLDGGDPKRKVFEELGVFDAVEFVRVPEFYRVVLEGSEIVVPDDARRAIAVLTERFPEEAAGIKKFFRVIGGIRDEISRLPSAPWLTRLLLPVFPFLYTRLVFNAGKTLGNFLDRATKNRELKLILAANVGYYHDDPYSLSLPFFSAAQAGFFGGGGHYVKGGSQKLSDHLAEAIRARGGEVLLKHRVSAILTQHGKAVGVRYESTRGKAGETHEVFARVVIANAAVPQVASLLPDRERLILEKEIRGLSESCSALCVYLGFDRPIKELGNRCYSTIVHGEGVRDLADLAGNFRADYSKRGFVFADYSQIDSGLAPEGKSVGAIVCLDHISNWEKLGEREYEEKKGEAARALIERLDRMIPGIKGSIEHCEVGTPRTMRRYTSNSAGAIYGYAQTPRQSGHKRLQSKSPIPNLFFASAWSNPGGGFTGAILGGWFGAREAGRAL